ncbi:hypothetical protein ACIMS1_003703 [Vibrio harveyi]
MKRKFFLAALILAPISVQASGIYVSPEVKIGSFRGAGIQLGATDIAGFDALYFDYSQITYKSGNYDETIDAYRIGFQHLFGHQPQMGFQASLGLAQYDGTYRNERRDANGFSIGGAYVYQVNPILSVRAGADLDVFMNDKTHTYTDTAINFSLGFGLRL